MMLFCPVNFDWKPTYALDFLAPSPVPSPYPVPELKTISR